MKKTLAILLAMLMILSVVLISCGKKDGEGDETLDDGNADFVIPGGTGGTGEGEDEGNNNNGGSSNSSGFSPIVENKDAYLLMSVKVRKTAKKSTSNFDGSVLYGSKVTRVETDGTWTKISYTNDGVLKEGYVYNEVLTTDAGRVTYVANETPVKTTSKTSSVTVRKVPWTGKDDNGNVLYSTEIDQIVMNSNGSAYQLTAGQEVEVFGTTQTVDGSGNKWAYIKYTVGTETIYGWCRMDFLNAGSPVDTPVVDPSTPIAPPAV